MSLAKNIRKLAKIVDTTADAAVLVWGSGKDGGEHYEKRRKVRAALKSAFPNASVHFSEDKVLQKAVPDAKYLNTPEQEFWHLAACNICIVLDTSKGAGEEIAHFVNSRYAGKLLILTHEKYKDVTTFPGTLRENQNQIFYTEDEYQSCQCVERVIARVRQVVLTIRSGRYEL